MKIKKGKLLYIGIGVVVVVGVAAGLLYFTYSDKPPEKKTAEKKETEKKKKQSKETADEESGENGNSESNEVSSNGGVGVTDSNTLKMYRDFQQQVDIPVLYPTHIPDGFKLSGHEIG